MDVRVKSLNFILLSELLLPLTLWSQDQRFGVLQGVVVDRMTHKPIENVNVFFQAQHKGTVTDQSGRFSIRLPLGQTIQVMFSHVSYDKLIKDCRFDRPDTLVLETSLVSRVIQSEDVTVTGKKPLSEITVKFTISGDEIRKCGEKDMEHKLRYLVPNIVKPYEVRMMHPSLDFTLYVNGKWRESELLNEIDPEKVKRVQVWDDPRLTPVGLPVIRGACVVSIETQERAAR